MKAALRWGLMLVVLAATGCAPLMKVKSPASSRNTKEMLVDGRADFGGFLSPGNWYRGNLHLHSTISDGNLDPRQTVEVYRRAGYDFVALTDHIGGFRNKDKKTFKPLKYPLDELNRDDFLVLPGMEYNTNRNGETIHFVVVGPGYNLRMENGEDLTHAVRKWWDAGAFALYAHPHWSLNSTEIVEGLGFLPALEVWNYGVAFGQGIRGNSQLHWDRLLRQSRPVFGVATDDAHRPRDVSCGGWVMVKAEGLTAESIVEALREGRFYASSGPRLDAVYFDSEGRLHVRCSPVKTIRAISTVGKSVRKQAKWGHNLRGAVLEWDWKHWGGSIAPFVRVECIDKHGRTAWTQAVLHASLATDPQVDDRGDTTHPN